MCSAVHHWGISSHLFSALLSCAGWHYFVSWCFRTLLWRCFSGSIEIFGGGGGQSVAGCYCTHDITLPPPLGRATQCRREPNMPRLRGTKYPTFRCAVTVLNFVLKHKLWNFQLQEAGISWGKKSMLCISNELRSLRSVIWWYSEYRLAPHWFTPVLTSFSTTGPDPDSPTKIKDMEPLAHLHGPCPPGLHNHLHVPLHTAAAGTPPLAGRSSAHTVEETHAYI